MPLREKHVTADFGRDKGTKFLITEMPALRADKFSRRLQNAISKGVAQVDGVGVSLLQPMGIDLASLADPDVMDALFAELLNSCVQFVSEDGRSTRALVESDINEVVTFEMLRKEAIAIHTFFLPKAQNTSESPSKSPKDSPKTSEV